MLSESARGRAAEGSRAAADRTAARQPGRAEGGPGAADTSCRSSSSASCCRSSQQVAAAKSLHFIFSSADSGVVWADPGLDVTADVIKGLDAARPPRRRSSRSRPGPLGRPGPTRRARADAAAHGCPSCAPAVRRVRVHHHPVRVDRLSFRYPLPLVDAVVDARARPRAGGASRTSRSTKTSSRATSRAAADAGRADDRVAGAGGDHPAARARRRAAETRAFLRGVDGVKFRRQVVPGRSRPPRAVRLERRALDRWRASRGVACVHDQVVAEADAADGARARRRRSSTRRPSSTRSAEIGAGTVVGPNAVIGPHVRIGPRCRIGASAVIDGATDDRRRHRSLPVRVDRPASRRT